ncbi:MAG: LamG domain-containing protein [Deltaproteobacteria bacterium]|nr:LamG domain-containing protein [Deltaproteobacteria bacterium]
MGAPPKRRWPVAGALLVGVLLLTSCRLLARYAPTDGPTDGSAAGETGARDGQTAEARAGGDGLGTERGVLGGDGAATDAARPSDGRPPTDGRAPDAMRPPDQRAPDGGGVASLCSDPSLLLHLDFFPPWGGTVTQVLRDKHDGDLPIAPIATITTDKDGKPAPSVRVTTTHDGWTYGGSNLGPREGTAALWVRPDYDPQNPGSTYSSGEFLELLSGSLTIGGSTYLLALRHRPDLAQVRAELHDLSKGQLLVAAGVPHTALVRGSWTHFAAVWNTPKATVMLYVNGRLQGSAGSATLPTGTPVSNLLRVGGRGQTQIASLSFQGAIDAVLSFSRVLTDAELKTLATESCPLMTAIPFP